jgi:hypothetical protein
VGDGFTASDLGFEIFCSGQYPLLMELNKHTYLATVHLQGDPSEEPWMGLLKRQESAYNGKERCHHPREKMDKGKAEDHGFKWQR